MQSDSALREERAQKLFTLQQKTSTAPYSILHRLHLAQAYKDLGYPDLSIGDAYKALLLADEVAENGEYHEEALVAATLDYVSEKLASTNLDDADCVKSPTADMVTSWVQEICFRAYTLLIENLQICGCMRTAFDFISRAKKAFPGDAAFGKLSTELMERVRTITGKSVGNIDIDEYPDKGLVRREKYPWNHHEPDRFSLESLQILNEELAHVAPKLEVRASELPILSPLSSVKEETTELGFTKQLGLFAKEEIPPGELILEEKSLLTAVLRFHELYCDACSILLPNALPNTDSTTASSPVIACEDCDEVYFCSNECYDLAQTSYHPSICGVTMDQTPASASEAADHLYTLLLVRALALAETQALHPLELKELRYIWGDYHRCELGSSDQAACPETPPDAFGAMPRTLPFTFKNNILIPLHVLEKMDVNIFTETDRYDTWIFNTLYAKFRGTASARQGLDGKPDTSAVHPMWCLANHSCDPNVAWDWKGTMRFWTRDHLVNWKGRDTSKQPGIKQDEEVFGHYCDVTLPVNERREWAVGALGGDCMCARCIWEAADATIDK